MTGDFCLCCHPMESHGPDDGPCAECNCAYFEFDPWLEAGPDGKPRTALDPPIGEREPLRLMTDEPPEYA